MCLREKGVLPHSQEASRSLRWLVAAKNETWMYQLMSMNEPQARAVEAAVPAAGLDAAA